MTTISQECLDLLTMVKNGNKYAEYQYLKTIEQKFMGRRIGRYISRNRLVDNEDLRQEFMIGVALAMQNANMEIGDPVEYTIQQGVYRVRSYLRKHVIQDTIQVCEECGHISRINRDGNTYVCKKCGSINIVTSEISDHNELQMEYMKDKQNVELEVETTLTMDEFERTLVPNTNVYNLYMLFKNGVNRDNPDVKNYLSEIARQWGCSNQNVLMVMRKLQSKVITWAAEHDMRIENNQFVTKDDIRRINK